MTNPKTIDSLDIAKCPTRSLLASHYRDDGSCQHIPGVRLEVEQVYSDGHESSHSVTMRQPQAGEIEDWWEHEVGEHCGDGHGAEVRGLGFCYTAKIVHADDPELIGLEHEWVGR